MRGGWALLPGNQRQDERQRPQAASGEVQVGYGRFRLDTGKNSFTGRAVRRWPRLPRAVGESPSLEGLKTHVAVALQDEVHQAGWGRGDGWT